MPCKGKRILLIDDDPVCQTLVRAYLEPDFLVSTASEGKTGYQLAVQDRPDLILLDLHLPEESGTVLCQKLRQDRATAQVPVIVLTVDESKDARIKCFGSGADDFVKKPFDEDELRVRIESKLLRSLQNRSNNTLKFGNLVMDFAVREVRVDGNLVLLAPLEWRILHGFLEAFPNPLSRDAILEKAWDGVIVSSRTVDAHIVTLRRKLRYFSYEFVTLYGVGYRLQVKTTSEQPNFLGA